jgi:hypothetical protein
MNSNLEAKDMCGSSHQLTVTPFLVYLHINKRHVKKETLAKKTAYCSRQHKPKEQCGVDNGSSTWRVLYPSVLKKCYVISLNLFQKLSRTI